MWVVLYCYTQTFVPNRQLSSVALWSAWLPLPYITSNISAHQFDWQIPSLLPSILHCSLNVAEVKGHLHPLSPGPCAGRDSCNWICASIHQSRCEKLASPRVVWLLSLAVPLGDTSKRVDDLLYCFYHCHMPLTGVGQLWTEPLALFLLSFSSFMSLSHTTLRLSPPFHPCPSSPPSLFQLSLSSFWAIHRPLVHTTSLPPY